MSIANPATSSKPTTGSGAAPLDNDLLDIAFPKRQSRSAAYVIAKAEAKQLKSRERSYQNAADANRIPTEWGFSGHCFR